MNKGGFDADHAREIIAQRAHLEGALLPMLHALQDAFGYVDDAVVPLLAHALNLSQAEVRGVISFYHDFRNAPAGRHVLKICRAESCQSMGAERLVEHLAQVHRLGLGTTSADGGLTVEAVYCLGHCALSPAAMLDGEPMARLSTEVLDAVVLEATGARA
jgi:formate dehydrogenase subunit gamma